ncbi:MAG: HD domain-containing protein, partial [Nitrososphaera sp.]|nr:HD domain-containing protein [Nitrososphaera sp.]
VGRALAPMIRVRKNGRSDATRSAELVDQLSSLFDNPEYIDLIYDIVSTQAFRRLRDIRFLGAIDYVVSTGGSTALKRHTRYEHSLGVGALARHFSKKFNLSASNEKHLVVAALLHDIGHGPLSHSLESVFKERFRLNHHDASALIIKGSVPIGIELPEVFRRHGLSQDEIVKLVAGRGEGLYAEALNNPINIDTIEAILRASTYITARHSLGQGTKVVEALANRGVRDVAILDEFWRQKDMVYEVLVSGSLGVVADRLCQEYFERYAPRFWSGIFFGTETSLRKEHPKLFEYLEQLRQAKAIVLGGDSQVLEYQKRHFYVDEGVGLDEFSNLYKRYRQEKVTVRVRVGELFRVSDSSVVPENLGWHSVWGTKGR